MWIYANIGIDTDEKIDGMCGECKDEIKKKVCTRCGDVMNEEDVFDINKNFDESRFKTLLEE